MGIIYTNTFVKAPRQRCFDLARSIDFHIQSTVPTKEQAVSGVQTGLIELGQEVTWRAKHFGLWLNLTSRITEVRKYEYFKDTMMKGPWKFMEHEHYFELHPEGTILRDIFVFSSPYGCIGRAFDKVILDRYLRKFLFRRNHHIKEAAETDKWKHFLP